MQNIAKARTAKENAATAMREMIPPLSAVTAIKTEGRIAKIDAMNAVNAGETLIILSRNDSKVTACCHVRGNDAIGAVPASFHKCGEVPCGGSNAVDIDGHFIPPFLDSIFQVS